MSGLAVFDNDDTLVNGQSQRLFLSFLRRKGVVSSSVYFKISLWFLFYKLGFYQNPKKIMGYAFGFLKGWPVEKMDSLVDEFFKTTLKNKIYVKGIDEIKKHQTANHEILLVSNAIEPIIKKIAGFLNVTNYVCTELEVTNGKYTGKIMGLLS